MPSKFMNGNNWWSTTPSTSSFATLKCTDLCVTFDNKMTTYGKKQNVGLRKVKDPSLDMQRSVSELAHAARPHPLSESKEDVS